MRQKKTLIFGWGKSGQAAHSFLQKRGASLQIYDDKIAQNSPIFWEEIGQIIVSPGIDPLHPLVQEAKKRGILCLSEVELGLNSFSNLKIGITGSNGKTTTTQLLEHLFQKAGFLAKALGNIGTAVCSYEPQEKEILLVELSSFQLELLHTPLFEYGICLNIFPNHLDRHQTLENYQKAKQNLAFCIKPGRKLWVGKTCEQVFSFVKAEQLPEYIAGRKDLSAETLGAAWLVAKEWKISASVFEQALATFQKPSHRLEYIGEKKGVLFYNDSKATNEIAVVFALQRFTCPIHLIVGGVDKKADFTLWQKSFPKEIKCVYAYGFAAEKICCALQFLVTVKIFTTLQQAAEAAFVAAEKGEIVLLSPGCASFDQFASFEKRGDAFKTMVQQWIQKEKDL